MKIRRYIYISLTNVSYWLGIADNVRTRLLSLGEDNFKLEINL